MYKEVVQTRVAWLAGLSVFVVTVVVTPATTLDPINLPKLWAISTFGISISLTILSQGKAILNQNSKVILFASVMVPICMAISMFSSDSEILKQFYGTYGRNTGWLTYFSLSCIFFGIAFATNFTFKKFFLIAAFGAISTNCLYGLIQVVNKDFVNWNKVYTPVYGTLGNPNFLSAFLGFGAAFSFGYLFARDSSVLTRISTLASIPLLGFVIYKSQSKQGLIVLALVAAVVLFFTLNNNFHSKLIQTIYVVIFVLASIFSILGSLNKGPFADYLYESSVTQRGDYWHAGIRMFFSDPITGVGLDSYGDWYRYFRSPDAAARFDGSVVSNTAHNVFIDIGATAGIFALISYFFVIFLALKSSWYIFKSNHILDPFFMSVFAAWVGYLAQSIISINNIALAIWGWVLPGILIAMERWQKEKKDEVYSKHKTKKTIDFSGMAMTAGLVIGAIVGFIPFNADANFRHALESGDANKIYIAAKKWPTDTSRFLYAAKIFEANNVNEKSEELVRISLKSNSHSFESWRFLYESSEVSAVEKAEILIKLKELDPNNMSIK